MRIGGQQLVIIYFNVGFGITLKQEYKMYVNIMCIADCTH